MGGDSVKPLIVYFSWSGTTEKAAKRIAKAADGDLIKLEPEKAYPASYGMTALKSLVEQIIHARPKLKTFIPNFDEYDRILIGFPIWWYNCPMLVCSFLEQYDFTGKQVYGFCTHGGSGPSKSFATMQNACKTGTVVECVDASSLTEQKIREWL